MDQVQEQMTKQAVVEALTEEWIAAEEAGENEEITMKAAFARIKTVRSIARKLGIGRELGQEVDRVRGEG